MTALQFRHGHQHGISGFTIIEVLIVLAIAGLIMLIVFLIVPTLQRNSRNYSRKNYADQIYSQMGEYYNSYGHYPGEDLSSPTYTTDVCNFLQSLPQVATGSTCVTDTSTLSTLDGTTADCVTIQAGPYTVCYQNWDSVSHGYIGPYDQISIMLAHWCNTGNSKDPSQPSGDPVRGNDTDLHRYVIWTSLEGNNTSYCIDNTSANF